MDVDSLRFQRGDDAWSALGVPLRRYRSTGALPFIGGGALSALE
jgi:hypothetical protein